MSSRVRGPGLRAKKQTIRRCHSSPNERNTEFISSKIESDKPDETQPISCPIEKLRKTTDQFVVLFSDVVGKTRNPVHNMRMH